MNVRINLINLAF